MAGTTISYPTSASVREYLRQEIPRPFAPPFAPLAQREGVTEGGGAVAASAQRCWQTPRRGRAAPEIAAIELVVDAKDEHAVALYEYHGHLGFAR